MTNNIDLDELVALVARHLTGENVDIAIKRLRWKNAYGESYRDPDGVAHVTIKPMLDPNTRYHALLHELAHVACKSAPLPVIDPAKLVPGGVDHFDPDNLRQYANDPTEAEADRQAQIWDAWADANIPHSRYTPNERITRKMVALLDYSTVDADALAQKVVAELTQKVIDGLSHNERFIKIIEEYERSKNYERTMRNSNKSSLPEWEDNIK
jgi:hypothetical protein